MSRKRAFRRARRRAEQRGGTWYKGRWCTAAALGTNLRSTATPLEAPAKRPPQCRAPARLRVLSYNIGGFSQECYDLFKHYLHEKCEADVVIVQETHHGLGRDDGHWLLPGWIVVTTADPKQRYSGVGVFLRRSVFADEQVGNVTWIPGRLLHVRCVGTTLTLDIVAGYQHVWQERHADKISKQRHHFWTQLGLLVQGLPTRHLLVLGADLNTQVRPVPGVIGRGVLKTRRQPEVELEALLREQQLVLLNTWGRSAASACGTFVHGSTCTQIDFLATRRRHADAQARLACPIALDLAPWRLGAKHRPIFTSLPWIAGWKVAPKLPHPVRFSLRDLRQAVKDGTSEAQELSRVVTDTVCSLGEQGSIQQLNEAVLPHCQRLFPSKRRPAHTRTSDPAITAAAERLWDLHRSQVPRCPPGSFRQASALWHRQDNLRRAARELRAAGQHRRRLWLEEQLQIAERAAERQDMGQVYRVINTIAPKKGRTNVRIRSAQGHLLSVRDEFQEIFAYFQGAFSRDIPYVVPDSAALKFTNAEISEAIALLKPGKAVPRSSLPADVWKLCPDDIATYCTNESTCYGGIMLRVDLSRAFDELPRASLELAMTHAGIPVDLQAAILEIHERCNYRVSHGSHSGVFQLGKGVRQGCALSPLLFTIYSCWLFDQFAECTSWEFANAVATLFADDSHAAFKIESLQDVGRALRAIRILFGLFTKTGMQVNSAKSCIVAGLRGSAARNWLRRHACVVDGKPGLSLGTPGHPLSIPSANRMVYLGVVASYGSFEMFTYKHRLKAAVQNRQRLLRTLHCRKFSLGCRVRLYVACVRSTLMYGLHAVGLPANVLRKLEAYDARALRAISNSPVHLTRESNERLRQRLKVPSPHQALAQLLGRRAERSGEVFSRNWFHCKLDELAAANGLVATEASWGVPCPDCGIYFTNHRHMRSHRTRQHFKKAADSVQPSTVRARPKGVLPSHVYAKYALDGMPTCRFCSESFQRVEGLKKHINGGCPSLVASGAIVTAPDPATGPVPGGAAGTIAADQPLFEDGGFRNALKQSWRVPLRDAELCRSLRTYCVFCHQWISLVGPGCKQHHRLCHERKWKHATAAVARVNTLGLDPCSPCRYCCKPTADPRRTPAMTELMEAEQELPRAALASREIDMVFGGKSGDTAAQDKKEEDWGKDWEEAGRSGKWMKQEGGKGPTQWPKNWSQKRGWEPSSGHSKAQLDQKVQHFMTTVARALIRHEADLTMLRADTSFVLFIDTSTHSCLKSVQEAAEKWGELFTKGEVKSPLKLVLLMGIFKKLKEALEDLQINDDKQKRCQAAGWLVEGRQALDPAWVYHVWNPQTKEQEVGETAPRSHTEILKDMDRLILLLPTEGLLLRFRCTQSLTDKKEGEVVPFMITVSLRSQAADEVYGIMQRLVGNACCKMLGMRLKPERAQRSQMSKQIEQAYQALDFSEWRPRGYATQQSSA
ncbi:pol [Symbiodinium sp. CCMP2592]|nr:pol [Symbiodinium sp. CCMP2592]